MNPSRLQSILVNLTASARHVLECVPADEPVAPQQVFTALKSHGHNIPIRKVWGCLKDLESQRLVKRLPHDVFQRSV